MLTSTNEDDVTRMRIHNNTLVNWAALGPCVRPFLFVNNTRGQLASAARGLGWEVEETRQLIHGRSDYDQY